MDAEEFVAKINSRDAHIQALTDYALALEQLLVDKRGEEAAQAARETAWQSEVEQLRHAHGLRTGTLSQR